MAPAGSQALPGSLWDQHREGKEVTATLETVVARSPGMSPRPCGEARLVAGSEGTLNLPMKTLTTGQCEAHYTD